MSPDPYNPMEVKMRHTDIIAKHSITSRMQMLRISRRQDCLVFFRTEKVNGMNGAIFFDEVCKVPVERRLGSVWTCKLNTLAEGLEALLLPEY